MWYFSFFFYVIVDFLTQNRRIEIGKYVVVWKADTREELKKGDMGEASV